MVRIKKLCIPCQLALTAVKAMTRPRAVKMTKKVIDDKNNTNVIDKDES